MHIAYAPKLPENDDFFTLTRSRRRDKLGEPIKSAHTFEIVLQICPQSLRKKFQLRGQKIHLDKRGETFTFSF